MRLALFLAFIASPVLANDCLYSVTPNAGLPGFNDEVIGTPSAAACLTACSKRDWCRSADYERAKGTCYLQSAGRHDAALQFDYADDPYDHYTCETRVTTQIPPSAPGCTFYPVQNAGIPGHNTEVIDSLTVTACQAACEGRPWCRSVDFERRTGTCYLQDVDMYQAQLKYDYGGNPYDHYTCSRN